MKRNFWANIGALAVLGATAAPTIAEEIAVVNPTSIPDQARITPFSLVINGYQGYFADRGIPSNGAFQWAIHFKRVDAEKLVRSAIAKGRLSPDALNDQSYLRKVQLMLDRIDRNGGRR
ncbi:hypothetical protein IQ238_16710 [Pleurocapsales cyanobacterium LEGE 06147]|nr:hypothetical protein [Pleurocapsales cyanobacterium LEGE 06147]